MTTALRLNVLIAHGEPLIQIGLEGALNPYRDLYVHSLRTPHSPGTADIERASFDVAVTDLNIGMELVRGERGKGSRVLVVTNDESEVGIRGAMEAGIRGYLLLSSTPESVAQAVRRVGQGGTAIDPRALARIISSLHGDRLTDREIDVLRLIALGRSNKAVANELGMAVGTVKYHVKHLMAKLNASSRTEAASIAQRRGLLPPERRAPRSPAMVDSREPCPSATARLVRTLLDPLSQRC